MNDWPRGAAVNLFYAMAMYSTPVASSDDKVRQPRSACMLHIFLQILYYFTDFIKLYGDLAAPPCIAPLYYPILYFYA